jgi:mxaJ protein
MCFRCPERFASARLACQFRRLAKTTLYETCERMRCSPKRETRSFFRILAAAMIVVFVPFLRADNERVLRIAADPNNLPFSNDRLEGFENRIGELIADELGARVEWVWHAQRRGFFRETLKENNADVVLGVPEHFDLVLTTRPYYRSTYVFVTRADEQLDVQSLDDPQLRRLKIGVQMIGNDGMNTPPAHALANRGIIDNVIGYTVYGDYAQQNPPARVVDAVAEGEVPIAIVWGPLAGYFAKRESVPLTLRPVQPERDGAFPFTFAIAAGVRKGNTDLRDEINRVLESKRAEIEKILDEYNLPRLALEQTVTTK